MHGLNILDLAVEDIVERITYVRNKWGDDIADNAYLELMAKLDLLASQPDMGVIPQELAALGISDYRTLVHESHTKVLYEVDDEAKLVIIHMVYSGNQDFQSLLYKRIIRAK